MNSAPANSLFRLATNGAAWLAALAAVWLWTWRHLATEWRLNEQYQFGFAVPLLAACLVWQRLGQSNQSVFLGKPTPTPGLGANLSIAGILLFFLAELLRQQDPVWRLTGWLMNSAALALSLAWIGNWGGPAAMRVLAFPLAFTCLALPWPSPLENGLTLKLMNLVTAATVHLLNVSGIAALRHGNVIELTRGFVGVDTACSGVQSFQSTLMAALFLGAWWQLSPARRGLLLFGGWTVALIGNLLRVYSLTLLVHLQGESAIERHHNSIGLSVTAFNFLMLGGIGLWLARRKQAPTPVPVPLSLAELAGRPGRQGFVVLAAVLLTPLLAWAWFAMLPGEKMLVQRAPLWRLQTRPAPGWKIKPDTFTAQESALLRQSSGESFDFVTPGGLRGGITHLFWAPADSVPSFAFSHTPEICLASAGWQSLGPARPVTLRLRGASFPAALHRFRYEGGEQDVLHAVWQGGRPDAGSFVTSDRVSRLTQLWQGPRRRGREVITLFLPATTTGSNQLATFQATLEPLVWPADIH